MSCNRLISTPREFSRGAASHGLELVEVHVGHVRLVA
jgi:hypothetical protein